MQLTKTKVVAGVVAALAVAGGGAAIAATKLASPQEESQAVIDDAAQQLGVQPSKLSGALKKALENRVDAAVAAGRISKDEAAQIKQRIESNDFPLFGFPHRGGLGFEHMGPLHAAAQFLGLTDAQLRTQLDGGKTLAQVAKDNGKSVDDLIQAMVADAKQHLDEAVSAGRLTQTQEDKVVADLKEHITSLVNGERPQFRGLHGLRPFGGPPPDARPAF
jgi:hypothetical protein